MKYFMKDKFCKYKKIGAFVTFLIIMVVTMVNKKNFHIDETLSYTLANNIGSTSMIFEEGHTYAPAEQVYLKSFAVNDVAERFNVSNVWRNQANDTHPPLYYMILHFICSLNLGKFSIWYAGIINIIFALLTLFILRKLMYLFVQDEVIIEFASILFSLSAGVLQAVSFLRMYVMAMFWVTLISYLFVRAYNEKLSLKLCFQIVLSAVAGALTHYYCIIYLCATCVVFGICLLIERRWKDTILHIVCMFLSAAVSLVIFPTMYRHMFFGERGVESIDNLTIKSMSEHWERIKSFYGFINTKMLGKIGGGGYTLYLICIHNFYYFKQEYCY